MTRHPVHMETKLASNDNYAVSLHLLQEGQNTGHSE